MYERKKKSPISFYCPPHPSKNHLYKIKTNTKLVFCWCWLSSPNKKLTIDFTNSVLTMMADLLFKFKLKYLSEINNNKRIWWKRKMAFYLLEESQLLFNTLHFYLWLQKKNNVEWCFILRDIWEKWMYKMSFSSYMNFFFSVS